MQEKITLILENDEEVELVLSFKKLALLKKVKNDLYQKYNSIMTTQKKEIDMFEMPFILYIAYWCANYSVGKEIYHEDEFLELVPYDFKLIKRIFNQLTTSKKNRNLEKNLSEKQA